ncbi:polysaccharide deacetylase family protein, partial [Lactococcus lactis]|uniref:polysaccharide deacetylase family protein n=1 Tax=Lactococcus lactis TaxID=1358 RepID=UPI0022E0B184
IGKAVVITFDDIDKSLPENAYPIMKKLDLPFTQFIITGKVGQTIDGSQMSTWKEIKKMNENPLVTSGLHTNDLHYQENFEPILSTNISKKVVQKDYQKSQKAFDTIIRENKKEIFMKAKNKSFKLLMVLSLLMCLVGINLFTTSNVFAADYGNKFITGHELTDDLGNPKTDFGIYDDVQAHWDFDIPVGSVSQGIQ